MKWIINGLIIRQNERRYVVVKKLKILLIFIVAALFGGVMLFTNYTLNRVIDEEMPKNNNLPSGFSSEDTSDEKVTVDVRPIRDDKFQEMTGLSECSDPHMDLDVYEIENVLDSKMNEWYVSDWEKTYTGYWVREYADGTSMYFGELMYYYTSSGNEMLQVSLEFDAVSNRIHNISMCMPFKDTAKTAFVDIMTWLNISEEDSVDVFDKMLEQMHTIGENESAVYDALGYHFYMSEHDYIIYEPMTKDKCYYISISIADMAE